MNRDNISDIPTYLRTHSNELGERILSSFPPLHAINDLPSPLISKLLRRPYAAQVAAIMGLLRRWENSRSAAVIAECGTGKTLISLGAVHCHSEGKPYTAIAMVPPQLVDKWAREAIRTVPRIRVFMIDGLRTPTKSTAHNGVNEVKLRNGRIVREGLRTSLTDLRLRGTSRTARERWDAQCNTPALFITGRDRGKLSYFWRHAYEIARCGRYQGSVVNPESGTPVYLALDGDGEDRLLAEDFKKAKLSEVLNSARRPLYSALWQADGSKIRRCSPIDFIGRYMPNFFDYAIADEVHELKGDTAQGNALGTLAACAKRIAVLTGTLLGGYADDGLSREFARMPVGMEGSELRSCFSLFCFLWSFLLSFAFAVSGGFWRLTEGGRSPTGVSRRKKCGRRREFSGSAPYGARRSGVPEYYAQPTDDSGLFKNVRSRVGAAHP